MRRSERLADSESVAQPPDVELDSLGSSPKLAEVGDRLLHEKGECVGERCSICGSSEDPGRTTSLAGNEERGGAGVATGAPAPSVRPLPVQRRRNYPRLPVKARESFLEALAAGWSVTHAAGRAGILRQRFYERRREDEEFALAWDDALVQGTEALEDEARRRAVEGWDEPVFQRGELVGHVRKYDSRLLEFLLRARDPARFRDRVEVGGGGGGPVEIVVRSMFEEPPATLVIEDAEVVDELEPPREGGS